MKRKGNAKPSAKPGTRHQTRHRLVSAAVPVQPTPAARPAQRDRHTRTPTAADVTAKPGRTRTPATPRRRAPIATRADQHTAERDRARGSHRLPALTPLAAADLAKLLMSGVPFMSALAMCDPTYYAYCSGLLDEDARDAKLRTWALAWQRDPALLAATTAMNGDDWQSLDAERRLQIAIDKHMAELAYFLYSRSYASLVGKDVDKADNARGAIIDFLKSKGGDPDAPWMKHLKDLVDKVGFEHAVPMLVAPTVPTAAGKQES